MVGTKAIHRYQHQMHSVLIRRRSIQHRIPPSRKECAAIVLKARSAQDNFETEANCSSRPLGQVHRTREPDIRLVLHRLLESDVFVHIDGEADGPDECLLSEGGNANGETQQRLNRNRHCEGQSRRDGRRERATGLLP